MEKRVLLKVRGVDYLFSYCPPGRFLMGAPEHENGRDGDETEHEIILTHGFYILITPVTQKMWTSLMGTNPSRFQGTSLPVEMVSWDDCQLFCRQLSSETGKQIQLPTEAQWEYACRAETVGPYAGCDTLEMMGWFHENSRNKSHPVGMKASNPWHIYDMHGNVSEWCQDWYSEFTGETLTDPTGPEDGSYRVTRGGSWNSFAQSCRSAFRGALYPWKTSSQLGFRVIMTENSENNDKNNAVTSF
ncbi:MAG: formylglycine-generating enzyme family protein [Thermoguttaceae bacterium]|nr:formylglycine-generating enzyme family protein [Thermoguttaceae bacterium]